MYIVCFPIFLFHFFHIYAYLEDTVDLVPDHHNKANIILKRVPRIFWSPSAYKSYAYTIL